MNAFVLGAIATRHIDQRRWPGKGRDAPLYDVASVSDLRHPMTSTPTTPLSSDDGDRC